MRQDFRKALSVLSAFALASFAANALATAQRTFVASTGVDTNACSITAPCRGFATAVAKTTANGEVIVLDSAGYGPVTLTTSISLIAPAGVYAGIKVFSGDGITINAPGSVVVLRGLTINGQGGITGIRAQAVARDGALLVSDDVISEWDAMHGRETRGASWGNRLSWSQYERYLGEIGFQIRKLTFDESAWDEEFYHRFEDVLGRIPIRDLKRDFFTVVLQKPL